jgi:hypothetical protein
VAVLVAAALVLVAAIVDAERFWRSDAHRRRELR